MSGAVYTPYVLLHTASCAGIGYGLCTKIKNPVTRLKVLLTPSISLHGHRPFEQQAHITGGGVVDGSGGPTVVVFGLTVVVFGFVVVVGLTVVVGAAVVVVVVGQHTEH